MLEIEDPDLKNEVRHTLISLESLRPAAEKCRLIPKAPTTHDHINFDDLVYKKLKVRDFILKWDRQPGMNKDIILMGTHRTVQQFTLSKYKSGDGTFKICPKNFYQVDFTRNHLYCILQQHCC